METTIKIFLFIGLWIISHSGFAQDVIVLRTGDEVKAIVQEIGLETIKYKKYTNADGPTYTILKSDVFMIKYQSGGKDVFSPDGEILQNTDNSRNIEKPQSVEKPGKAGTAQIQQNKISEPDLSINRNKINKGSAKRTKQSAEDILREYETYKKVDSIQNKLGISLKVSMFLEAIYINPLYKDSEKNKEMCNKKFHIKDAETLEDIPANIGSVKEETKNKYGEILSTEYGSFFQIAMKTENTGFLIIYFDGISKAESEEFETPPLFFLVQRDKNGTVVLTKTPKLLGNMFKSGQE